MTKSAKPRLGRGLSSLISQPVQVSASTSAQIDANQTNTDQTPGLKHLLIEEIVPSQFQPRSEPAKADIEPLAASIRTSGVMQPIAVRPLSRDDPRSSGNAKWELVAGERRWRAAALAELKVVPALVADLSDQEAAEWGLAENVQRSDLNPMERAHALRQLSDLFGLSHTELAKRLGLERSSISNLIRLNELEPEIQAMLSEGEHLTVGHGKALLGLPAGKRRVQLAKKAVAEGWSVRRLEGLGSARPETRAVGGDESGGDQRDPVVVDLERQLGEQLGTRVRLRTNAARTKGRIVIDFFSHDHFEGLVQTLGVALER